MSSKKNTKARRSKPSPKTIHLPIVWDFDKTLTSFDSTNELIRVFSGKQDPKKFWRKVKKISGSRSANSISTSDAPVWMYLLSELAFQYNKKEDKEKKEKPLVFNIDTFGIIIAHKIKLYRNVIRFLKKIKKIKKSKKTANKNLKFVVHHFVITAGLADLVESVFKLHKEEGLITEVFGCKYKFIKGKGKHIPIYCMDKTTKTRSLFEIVKGCFPKGNNPRKTVDHLISDKKNWCSFEDLIYVGDGDTDIPAFSLTKGRKGTSIGVFNQKLTKKKKKEAAKRMRKGKRIDFYTPAHFALTGDLFKFIKTRHKQIIQKYEAHNT